LTGQTFETGSGGQRSLAQVSIKTFASATFDTAPSLLIAQGCHPKVVQEHLGHSSIVVTMELYGQLYLEDRSKVSNALDAAFVSSQLATA
jgi:hypothetical protein